MATLRRKPLFVATQIVFITGSDQTEVAIRAVEAGAAAVLYKPLDEHVLRNAVLVQRA